MSAMFSPSVCFPFTCQKEKEEEAARACWPPTDLATLSCRPDYPELLPVPPPLPGEFRRSLSLPSPLLCGCLCTRESRACVRVLYFTYVHMSMHASSLWPVKGEVEARVEGLTRWL